MTFLLMAQRLILSVVWTHLDNKCRLAEHFA